MLQKPWFKNKTYGWGWYPATWQGWLVMLTWLIVELGCVFVAFRYFGPASSLFALWVVGISTISATILVIIAWLTGEKPRWQWGDKK